MKPAIARTIFAIAAGRQAQGFAARNVIAPKILDRSATRDLQFRRSSRQRHIEKHFSPPALIVPGEEFRELPELRSAPFQAEMQWSIAQGVRTLPDSTHLQQAYIVQVQIGAKGLRFQPYAPTILGLLPQGKIGIGQGVRFFFWATLEIDSRRGGCNVRKSGTGF